ncbi:YfbU family protein [Mesorhizobium sp. M0494]|uniref:YfbU family protein n=1 Tax=Mesorhizobium sp. M0494 TaxID=2956951 RepID=UPI00333C5C74
MVKTERFELRLDESTIDRIDAWRGEQRDLPSRAEAIRTLVYTGLEAGRRKAFRPTSSEKLIMWMLGEVLRQHKGYEDMKSVELIQSAIYGGHFWGLEWEMSGIFHDDVDDPEALDFVVNTMAMWRAIEWGYEKLSPVDRQRVEDQVGYWVKDPKFDGFDGNEEGRYMSMAKFMVEKLGRFEEFRDRSLNAHANTVSTYREMLQKYAEIEARRGSPAYRRAGQLLNADELIELLKLR